MANLGTFAYLGPNGLPIRALDGGQNTGTFAYLGVSRLPVPYLMGRASFGHLKLGTLAVTTLKVGASSAANLYLGSMRVT